MSSPNGENHSPIRAVFFDLGNVLLDFDFGRAARKLSRLTGRPEPELTWSVATVVERTRYEFGHTRTDEFLKQLSRALGLQMERNELRDLWSDIFSENAEMIALARSLRGIVPRHVLSNTNELHIEFIRERFPFFAEFDGYVYSYEERVGKPDSKIYEIALQRAHAAAAHSLFIDDREENVHGARQVGMRAIHYANRTQAMKEIRQCLQLD